MVEILGSKRIDDETQATTFRIENGNENDVETIMKAIFGDDYEDEDYE